MIKIRKEIDSLKRFKGGLTYLGGVFDSFQFRPT